MYTCQDGECARNLAGCSKTELRHRHCHDTDYYQWKSHKGLRCATELKKTFLLKNPKTLKSSSYNHTWFTKEKETETCGYRKKWKWKHSHHWQLVICYIFIVLVLAIHSPKLTLSPACPFKLCGESQQTQSHANRCEGERGTNVRDMTGFRACSILRTSHE